MTDNDFSNIEYHGMQAALREKINSKIHQARDFAEKAPYEEMRGLIEHTNDAIRLLIDVQELYQRLCGNKAKRLSGEPEAKA